jgi:hypothetical protein
MRGSHRCASSFSLFFGSSLFSMKKQSPEGAQLQTSVTRRCLGFAIAEYPSPHALGCAPAALMSRPCGGARQRLLLAPLRGAGREGHCPAVPLRFTAGYSRYPPSGERECNECRSRYPPSGETVMPLRLRCSLSPSGGFSIPLSASEFIGEHMWTQWMRWTQLRVGVSPVL